MVAERHRHKSTKKIKMSKNTYDMNSCSSAYPPISPVLSNNMSLRWDTPSQFSRESYSLKRDADTVQRATCGINNEMYGRPSDAGVIGYYGHSISDDSDTSYSISGYHGSGTCTSRSVDSTAISYVQRAPGSTRTAHL